MGLKSNNYSNTAIPKQNVPSSKKMEKRWQEDTLKFFIESSYYSTSRKNRKSNKKI